MPLGKYAFYYGVTTGFALALISLLSFIPVVSPVVGLVRFIAMILLTMFFIRRYRDEFNDNRLSGGEAFRLTFLMFLYVGIIAALFIGFQIKIAALGSSDELFTILQDTYADAGIDVSDQMISSAIALVPYMAGIFALIGHLIIGAIVGAIYSSAFKRETPSQDIPRL